MRFYASVSFLLGVASSSTIPRPAARDIGFLEDRSIGTAINDIFVGNGAGTALANPSTSITVSTTSSTPASAPTSVPLSISSSLSSSSCPKTAAVRSTPSSKPVFFHYMIGTVYDQHCEQDIKDAQALGVDAFALNLSNDSDSWATGTVALLFKWANVYGFKLFFSFDMSGFSNPDQFTDFLLSYVTNAAYYQYGGLPFVSTFNGGASSFTFGQSSVDEGWKVQLKDVMAAACHPIYFVPAFQDVAASPSFFTTFSTVDGAMNWNSWPFEADGKIIVPVTDDKTYQTAAKAAKKTFLMGVSPLQYKHIDASQNWYRCGEQNLEYRFGQVLAMQPDFVELQTWNDAGESHYMGNSWPEPISGTDEGAYTVDYDHTGYQEILPAFITAYKSGASNTDTMYPTNSKSAQGVFWHHTLLVGGDCSADSMGKPSGIENAEDTVTAVVLVQPGHVTYNVSIVSGGTTLGTHGLVPGYNSYSVSGMKVGNVTVEVIDTSTRGKIIGGTGPIAVTSSSSLCNYNFQVVALK